MVEIRELDGEQRRRFIDTRDMYAAYEATLRQYNHECSGHMRWVQRRGQWYLHYKRRNSEKSLGPQSPRTEHVYNTFYAKRRELRERLRHLSEQLNKAAPVNRAVQIAGIPKMPARLIRALQSAKIGGSHVHVIGTNALYAYEAMTGTQLPRGVLSTGDTDFLFDGRRNLAVLSEEVRADGLIGLLRKVDKTFRLVGPHAFCAVNNSGMQVDLITAETRSPWRLGGRDHIGETKHDLKAAPIPGLEWLIHAPKVSPILLDERGYPLRMWTVDPRVFALHKAWLAKRADRDPIKADRDRQQAEVAALLSSRYLALDFNDQDLSALPQEVRALSEDVLPSSEIAPSSNDLSPDW